jgi:hypothetical protein
MRGLRSPCDENCVVARFPAIHLRTTVLHVHQGRRGGTVMSLYYSSPALDAELAYRREVLQALGRGTRTRRNGWFRSRRRAR